MGTEEITGRRESDKELFERISQTEVDIAEMKANQGAILKTVSQLSYDVRDLTRRIGEHKTPWAVLISAMSLLLALVTALGWGFVGLPMKEIKVAQIKTHDAVMNHVKDGHPNALKQLVDLEIEYLTNTVERLTKVSEWQQQWVFEHYAADADIHAMQTTKLEELFRQVDRMNEIDNQRASHEERLRSLERQSFSPTSYRDGRPGG